MQIVETKKKGIRSAYTLIQKDRVLTLHVLSECAIYREDHETEMLIRNERESVSQFKVRCVENAIALLSQNHKLTEVLKYAN